MKYLILHGSFSTTNSNWIPWLKSKLEARGETVIVPQMPIGVGKQNFDSWSAVFDQLNIDEETVIIAHSIAPVFVYKYLILHKQKVAKLFFVCGFNNYLGIDKDYDSVNEPMFTDELEKVKDYCSDIACFYSENDPYVSYDAEKTCADTLTKNQIVIKDGGHLNSESGYTEFEELLKML